MKNCLIFNESFYNAPGVVEVEDNMLTISSSEGLSGLFFDTRSIVVRLVLTSAGPKIALQLSGCMLQSSCL